jgi:uncharacterized damage-inducible protein DinB
MRSERSDIMPRGDLEPQVGLLMAMLDDVRRTTLKGCEGMSADDLHRLPEKGEYPLGAYLMHLGEAEIFWLEVMTGDQVPDEVKRDVFYCCWFDPSQEPQPPAKPMPLEEYVSRLAVVRGLVKTAVRKLEDAALDAPRTIDSGDVTHTVTPRWILYHLIEHEAHHRGQMMLWKRWMGL